MATTGKHYVEETMMVVYFSLKREKNGENPGGSTNVIFIYACFLEQI